SLGYSVPLGRFPRVTHPSAAHPEGRARLACVRPAASVRSEPGSNSQVESPEGLSLTREPCTSVIRPKGRKTICLSSHSRGPSNSEADTLIIAEARGPTCKTSRSYRPNRPHIPSEIQNCQKAAKKTNRQHQSLGAHSQNPSDSHSNKPRQAVRQNLPNPGFPAPTQPRRLGEAVFTETAPKGQERKFMKLQRNMQDIDHS